MVLRAPLTPAVLGVVPAPTATLFLRVILWCWFIAPARIDREHAYTRFRPGVEGLVSAQTCLCNRLVGEAKELLEKAGVTADDRAAA